VTARTSCTSGSPVSTAIAILVLVTAAALTAGAVAAVGWLAGLPASATGLCAYGALALILGVGLYITFRRGQPRKPDLSVAAKLAIQRGAEPSDLCVYAMTQGRLTFGLPMSGRLTGNKSGTGR
jgi:hypothetical protein